MSGDSGRSIDALLQRSEELTATLYGGDELPRVKRNLTQVLDAGKRLWSKTAAHGTEAHQVKAALLLGKFTISQVVLKLSSRSTWY